MFRKILALTLALLLLSGCQTNPAPTDPDPSPADETTATELNQPEADSTEGTDPVSSTAPELLYGTLETQRIGITAVGGRTENLDTGYRPFTEKEAGYYFQYINLLYYADKSNLSLWVPVCGKANCAHKDTSCDAYTFGSSLVTEDRIYYLAKDQTSAATAPGVVCEFLVSMALDGTDRKVEFYFEDLNYRMKTFGSGGSYVLTPEHYVVYNSNMNTEGRYENILYVADEEGEYIAYSGVGDVHTADNYCGNTINGIYGDFCYYMANVSGNYTTIYRLQDRQLYSTDLGDLPVTGSHLDGNSLRFYRPGDGYYDIDLTTRQETRLDDAQLDNACAHIMLPNCIFETTLEAYREAGLVEEHQLRFYDGVRWYEVTLPEELVHADDDTYLDPVTIISDRVIFRCDVDLDGDPSTPGETWLYQMLLEQEEPVLELMAVLTSN